MKGDASFPLHSGSDFKKRVRDIRNVISRLSVQFRDQAKTNDGDDDLSREYDRACEYLYSQQKKAFYKEQNALPLDHTMADRFCDISYIDREVAPELIYLSSD